MAETPRDDEIVVTDPRAIRALAHPARLAVLDELSSGRALTATECGEITGLSASAMSYHLRALRRWGLVERAEHSGDRRERRWRLVGTGGWRVEPAGSSLGVAATDTLTATMFDRIRSAMHAWSLREHEQPRKWQDASMIGATTAWVTSEEARELIDHYQALAERARARTDDDHPRGARRVQIAVITVPSVED